MAYYILKNLDGYGSTYPTCIGRREAYHLLREWDTAGDLRFDDVWTEATTSDIQQYGINGQRLYTVRWGSDDHPVTVSRWAENAGDAIESICNQYGWRGKLDMYDSDTRGDEWAEYSVDTDGGINYNRRIIAERSEEESK